MASIDNIFYHCHQFDNEKYSLTKELSQLQNTKKQIKMEANQYNKKLHKIKKEREVYMLDKKKRNMILEEKLNLFLILKNEVFHNQQAMKSLELIMEKLKMDINALLTSIELESNNFLSKLGPANILFEDDTTHQLIIEELEYERLKRFSEEIESIDTDESVLQEFLQVLILEERELLMEKLQQYSRHDLQDEYSNEAQLF